MRLVFGSFGVVAALACQCVGAAAQTTPAPLIAESRQLLADLVGINTAEPDGNTTTAATRIADYLKAAGLPAADVQVIGSDARRGNLVARLRGRGTGKPVLFLAHLDVVPDEASNGVMWMLKHHPALLDAAYVINGDAGGGGIAPDGRYIGYGVQAGEKLYADFTLEVTHEGGHSSRPVKENPIYRLAAALSRVEKIALPLRTGPVTQSYLAFLATTESGQKAADLRAAAATPADALALQRLATGDPSLNAQLRTTCVATQVTAGHAPNALPQRARANVNCRILPGDTPVEVRAAIVKAIDDAAVTVTQTAGVQNAPVVRLDPAVMALIGKASAAVWPGVPVIPVLEVGGTDGFFPRERDIDVYGVNHFQRDEDARAHGKDERIGIKQFDEAARFGYDLAKIVATN